MVWRNKGQKEGRNSQGRGSLSSCKRKQSERKQRSRNTNLPPPPGHNSLKVPRNKCQSHNAAKQRDKGTRIRRIETLHLHPSGLDLLRVNKSTTLILPVREKRGKGKRKATKTLIRVREADANTGKKIPQ